MKKAKKMIIAAVLCFLLLCGTYLFILLKPYHTIEDFAWVTIGKTTIDQINLIAPASIFMYTSFGGMSEYPTKDGKFILIRYYGPDLIIGDIRVNEGSMFEPDPVIKSGNHYQITRGDDGLIYCSFINKNGFISKREGPFAHEPHVTELNNHRIGFLVQTGTGTETNWGYYYDTEAAVFSEKFQSIYDQTDTLVVYSKNNTLVVQDIFDTTAFYKTFTEFQFPFSPTAAPFVRAEFTANSTILRVTYLTGEDFTEVTENFLISLD